MYDRIGHMSYQSRRTYNPFYLTFKVLVFCSTYYVYATHTFICITCLIAYFKKTVLTIGTYDLIYLGFSTSRLVSTLSLLKKKSLCQQTGKLARLGMFTFSIFQFSITCT